MASPGSPVFKSMTKQIIFFGVPFSYALFAVVVAMFVFIFSSNTFMLIGIFLTLWIFGIYMTKKDPRWVEVIIIRFKVSDIDFSEEIHYDS